MRSTYRLPARWLLSCLALIWLLAPTPAWPGPSIGPGFIPCGGIAGLPCPGDATCFDIPGDGQLYGCLSTRDPGRRLEQHGVSRHQRRHREAHHLP